MRISKINNIERYNNITKMPFSNHNFHNKQDIFFGNKIPLVQAVCDFSNYIENQDIDKLEIRRKSLFSRILNSKKTSNFSGFQMDKSDDWQNIKRCDINSLNTFRECELTIDDSTIGSLDLCMVATLRNCNIKNLTNCHHVIINNSDNNQPAGNINADYVTVLSYNYNIDNIKSHSTFIELHDYYKQAVKIDKITTNLISMKSAYANDLDTDYPVEINKLNVVPDNIVFYKKNLESFGTYSSDHMVCDNGTAKLNNFKINELNCVSLTANNGFIKKANINEAQSLENVTIDELKTSKIKNMKNVHIKKLIVPSNEIVIPKGENIQIDSVEFEKGNGKITIYNNNTEFPNPTVINGEKIFKFENLKTTNIVTDGNVIIGKNVTIPNIQLIGKQPKITIIGPNNLKNILFKNKGEVIIQDNEAEEHVNIKSLNIINGEITKDYKLKGLEAVAGMTELKQQLYDDVINPLLYKEKYEKYDIHPINGFMLYGPPGCGKTFIAEKLAEETGRTLITISPKDIGSIYQHQPAMKVAEKFSSAIASTPSIVFIDEAESLLFPREGLSNENPDYNEMITEFLQQMNKCSKYDVLIITASNEPQKIDKAIQRTGRTDKKIYVGPPDAETRKELFIQKLKNIYNDGKINIEEIANKTNNYTAEDIRMVLRKASLEALHNDRPVCQNDIEAALQEVKPSISEELVKYYKQKGEM